MRFKNSEVRIQKVAIHLSQEVITIIKGTTFVVDDKYELIKHISHGAYGIVCSSLNKQTKKKVAIKKVKDAFDDLVDAKRILREIRLLSNYLNLEFFDNEHVNKIIDL